MQLYKWCRFLMRRMSPLGVGLICLVLIGVSSSSSSLHSRHFREDYFTHPTVKSEVKLKKHVIRPSVAKDHRFHRTKLPTESPKYTSRNFTSSGSTFGNGTEKKISNKGRPLPNLNLSSKFRVRNASDANSTIVFFPRYSRAMGNFSKSSVNKELQPIIVSSHRRELLTPENFKSGVDKKYMSRTNIPPQSVSFLENKKISQNVTSHRPTKRYLIFHKSSSSPKYNRTNSHQKDSSLFKRKAVTDQSSSGTSILVKVKNDNKSSAYTNKNSTIFHILPSLKPRNHHTGNLSQKLRRGRNFALNDDSRLNEEDERSLEIVITQTKANGTTNSHLKNVFTTPENLDNYTDFPSSQRQFVTKSYRDSSTEMNLDGTELTTSIPLTDLGTSYTEKKANNLTIYEILKPRLKTDSPEGIEYTNSSIWPQYDYIVDTRMGFENTTSYKVTTNKPDIDETYNTTLVTNTVEYKSPPIANSMLILPGRSDSSFSVEYVMINRSNSVVPPLSATETDSNQILQFGLRTSNNSRSNSQDQLKNVSINADDINESRMISINPDDINESRIISTNPDDIDEIKITSINPGDINESRIINETLSLEKDLLRLKHVEATGESTDLEEDKFVSEVYDTDIIRKPKMTDTINTGNTPFKSPKLDSKMFYDYFAKRASGNVTLREFPYPEFRPGNFFRYSDIYQRKPILDAVYTRPTPLFKLPKPDEDLVTRESILTPTTFNSLRTSVRVLSTFYPNRMQDVTMKFGNRVESSTLPMHPGDDKNSEYRHDDDFDDSEYRDALDPGFTMEKLAYLLIGTCCGLSILCLFVVVIAIKCRRAIVEKRLKAQFRKRMYYHEKMKEMATPWQQQMFDHFMYLHRRPLNSSCSSGTDSCNCRCVTWSLGARNLDSTRPLCSTNRSSQYLLGQKKLPFGAASTLRYESMLGRKRTSPEANRQKADTPNTDSSHENDSLDVDSDSREGDGPKQCTCIDYNVWPMGPPNVPHGFFTMCPNPRRYNAGNCSQHPPVELRTVARDVPPPVTGSNYLDRSEGVVYWSSNEERLI